VRADYPGVNRRADAHTREEVFSDPKALGLAGFLASYSGLTREASALDLRQFASWCAELDLALFGAQRMHIEAFACDLEARGRSRATTARRFPVVASGVERRE
jgi:hypothetical protein